jgi:hypothetical protein
MQCCLLHGFVILVFLSSSLALPCSVNVVSPGNFIGHSNYNIPNLTSLHQAAEYAANVFSSGRAPLFGNSIAICIFGKHVLSRPLVIDGPLFTSSHDTHHPIQHLERVEWVGFDAEVSGAIDLFSWTPLSGANSTFVTKRPHTLRLLCAMSGLLVTVRIAARS